MTLSQTSLRLSVATATVAAASLFVGVDSASAQTFTFADPEETIVTGIQGLDVGGVLTDVSFAYGSFSSVFPSVSPDSEALFFNDRAGASLAAEAIYSSLSSLNDARLPFLPEIEEEFYEEDADYVEIDILIPFLYVQTNGLQDHIDVTLAGSGRDFSGSPEVLSRWAHEEEVIYYNSSLEIEYFPEQLAEEEGEPEIQWTHDPTFTDTNRYYNADYFDHNRVWAVFSESAIAEPTASTPEPAFVTTLLGFGAAALAKRKLSQSADA